MKTRRLPAFPQAIRSGALPVQARRAALPAVVLAALTALAAAGCSSEHPVQRYLRDAKIMEIIEGSNQIQQISIADYAYQEYSPDDRKMG